MRELDATRLTPSTGLDLRLDDDGAPAELGRGFSGLVGGGCYEGVQHGDAVGCEEVARLVFEEVQRSILHVDFGAGWRRRGYRSSGWPPSPALHRHCSLTHATISLSGVPGVNRPR